MTDIKDLPNAFEKDSELRAQKLKLQTEHAEEKLKLVKGLPHRHAWPWYKWARAFFESRNKINLLVAANQISKSSTQIRKIIEWSCNDKLWAKLWRTRPWQFWYLYPTKEVATIEFEKKWVTEFLPAGEYKNHPKWGWKHEKNGRWIHALHFNSGVSIYFKTYAMESQALQSGSCHAIFTDEELPENLWDELQMRMAAVDGYFHCVFTATLGQEFWRKAMEERGAKETFKTAFKQQIAMRDCLFYDDGTPSMWTEEKIRRIEDSCRNEAERLRRVEGRFVLDAGRKYQEFVPSRHYIEPLERVKEDELLYYAGLDYGSGNNHKSAVVIIGVEKNYKRGYVVDGWIGAHGIDTTAGDVVNEYRKLSRNRKIITAYYDFGARDLYTIAIRQGISLEKAEKSHELGESIMNTLFQNDMLFVYDIEQLHTLGSQLLSMLNKGAKTNADDDYVDAARYGVAKIPWDYQYLDKSRKKLEKVVDRVPKTDKEWDMYHIEQRRKAFGPAKTDEVNEDFDFWNEMYGN